MVNHLVLALTLGLTLAGQPDHSISLHALYVAAPAEYQVGEFAVNRSQHAEDALLRAAPSQYGLWVAAATTVSTATIRLRVEAPEELARFLSGPESETVAALADLRAVAGPALLAWEQANEANEAAEALLIRVAPDEWEEYDLSKKVLLAAATALASAAPDEWAEFLAEVSR
ncbi:MAG: hypothetical protein OXC14_03985 [Rhodospirillaceae bacterium]|nr:hypothetical protein [Rhodospirillaceae bacterium]